MLRFPATFFDRLDAVYRDQPSFVVSKARLLAAFDLLLLAFVPFNVAKILWIQPPEIAMRFGFNALFAFSALLSLHWIRRGRLDLAGGSLVLTILVPIHTVAFLVPTYPEPVSAAMMLFILDLVMLLLAIVFASRRVALAVLVIVVASHVAFHLVVLRPEPIAGSLRFAADTIFRDGLITMGFVFMLGLTLVSLIEAAILRSDQALRETRATNENLGRLVVERTRELEAATRAATEASRAKGDFLANMSHEIRTPLHAIVASADLLRSRPGLSQEAAEDARLIVESGDLLLELVGDILDFSKIEAGQLVLENRVFELAALAADSVALVAPRAAQSGVQVEFAIAPGLARAFEGDSFRLRQVLLNLLSNGIKFTPAGGSVKLAIECPDSSADPAWIRFEVSDSGIGMEAATMKRLFERFTQADSSTTRRYGGSGLGLSISARLVELMGGTLEADSVPGEGSTFHFAVPLRPAILASASLQSPPEIVPRLGLEVLVAEDNATNRKILGNQLEKLGCRCTMVADGEEMLAAAEREPVPDLVLMDCHMPRLDGWEATRRIRQWALDPQASPNRKRASRLPIVALTAAALPEERRRCIEAGMTDFLAKPVKLADLRRVLQQHAGKSSEPPT